MVAGPATWPVQINGEAQVEKALTADTSNISDRFGVQVTSITYQWLANNARIRGATSQTYRQGEGKQGKKISVMATYTDDRGNEDTLISAPTDPVAARERNNRATGLPLISGRALVGQTLVGETLTADTSGIVDADGLEHVPHSYLWGISGSAIIGAVYGYQWLADEAEIEDATGSTYILADVDEGKAIKVRVSFTDDGGHRETLTSSATAAVTQAQRSGYRSADRQRKGPGGRDADGGHIGHLRRERAGDATFTHQWITDDSVVVGTASRVYTPTGGDQGKAVKVRVSFTDDAGNWETRTSAQTAAVEARSNSPATGLPTISGTARVGETLTADMSDIEDANGLANATFSYLWVSSDGTTDTDIEKAPGSTYKLVATEQGKSIKVIVTFADDAGNEETLTSAPTGPVLREPVLGDGSPGAPRNLTVTAGDREVTLSWEPPADNGNPPAERYRIEWEDGRQGLQQVCIGAHRERRPIRRRTWPME